MSFVYVDAAIVVLAESHNPSILHPTFLRVEHIVPENWTPDEPPICTPPFAVVKYQGRLEISAEQNKLQFRDVSSPEDIKDSDIQSISMKYVKKLPYVRYTAVGINFTMFWDTEKAQEALIDRFIQSGPLNDEDLSLESVGLRLVYPHDPAKLRISIDAARRKVADGTQSEGVVLRGNYEQHVASEPTVKKVTDAIGKFADYADHFADTSRRILGLNVSE